jgi:hypothetical protein
LETDTYAAYPSQLRDSTRPALSLNLRNHFGASKILIFLKLIIIAPYSSPTMENLRRLIEKHAIEKALPYEPTGVGHMARFFDDRPFRKGGEGVVQIERDSSEIPSQKARRTVKQNPR